MVGWILRQRMAALLPTLESWCSMIVLFITQMIPHRIYCVPTMIWIKDLHFEGLGFAVMEQLTRLWNGFLRWIFHALPTCAKTPLIQETPLASKNHYQIFHFIIYLWGLKIFPFWEPSAQAISRRILVITVLVAAEPSRSWKDPACGMPLKILIYFPTALLLVGIIWMINCILG